MVPPSRTSTRYLAAVGIFAAALAVRLALQSWLGTNIPFMFFLLAAAGAGAVGGFGPSLVVTALGGVTAVFLYLEPRGYQPLEIFYLNLYLLTGCGIGGISAVMHRAVRQAGEREALAVSRQLALEEEARRREAAEEAVRAADRRKTEFLAVLAHELRGPLAAARAAVEVLGRTAPSPPAAVLDRQLRHLARLVDDLLDLARITRGKIRVTRTRVALRAVLDHAVETSRPLFDARRHRLAVRCPDRPVELDADPDRLAQVVANLLTNAAKYTPEGGDVELVAECDADAVTVRVRDTGVGIPADQLAAVFEPFAQLDRSVGHSLGGLGVGLALVRRLVELHGGTVEARSGGPGAGSEFVVRLPTSAEPGTRSAERGKDADADGPLSSEFRVPRAALKTRVLVVDDNRDAADSLADLLRLLGYDARAAYDGPAALAALGGFGPDVALVDLGLPGMNGYELGGRVRAARPGLPVVALTGRDRPEDRDRTRAAGFAAHLVKPVGPDELRRALGAATADPTNTPPVNPG